MERGVFSSLIRFVLACVNAAVTLRSDHGVDDASICALLLFSCHSKYRLTLLKKFTGSPAADAFSFLFKSPSNTSVHCQRSFREQLCAGHTKPVNIQSERHIKKTINFSSPAHWFPSLLTHLSERRVRFWNGAISAITRATRFPSNLSTAGLHYVSPLMSKTQYNFCVHHDLYGVFNTVSHEDNRQYLKLRPWRSFRCSRFCLCGKEGRVIFVFVLTTAVTIKYLLVPAAIEPVSSNFVVPTTWSIYVMKIFIFQWWSQSSVDLDVCSWWSERAYAGAT